MGAEEDRDARRRHVKLKPARGEEPKSLPRGCMFRCIAMAFGLADTNLRLFNGQEKAGQEVWVEVLRSGVKLAYDTPLCSTIMKVLFP